MPRRRSPPSGSRSKYAGSETGYGFGAVSGSADSVVSDSVGDAVGLGSLGPRWWERSRSDRVARGDSPPPEHPDSSSIAATGTAIRRTSYERVAMTTTTYDVRPKFSRRGG